MPQIKVAYLSSLVYLTIFPAGMCCGQSGTRSDFSPIFTFSFIRPMKNKTMFIFSFSAPGGVFSLLLTMKLKQNTFPFSIVFWDEKLVK
jgi:hypothetical protein